MKCSIPTLVPCYKLAKFLDGINFETLLCVESLCEESGENVNGYYRGLKELLPRLAEFYLKVYKEEDFIWFGNHFTFKVAIGGDGAPFGKKNQSCTWLVSFLNI